MQFNSSLLALACAFLILGLTAAVPAPAPAPVAGPTLQERAGQATGHIYICTEGNFGGECKNYTVSNGTCTNFPSGFSDQISSWGPDQGWVCTIFTNQNCGGATYTGSAPGFSSLLELITP